MNAILEQTRKMISSLSRAEKAQVLQWVAKEIGDAATGIESRPEVCGGDPCVVRTRIPVWVLEKARRTGTSEADLLHIYPSLRAEDLTNAWAYIQSHSEEIERQICDHEEA